MIVAVLLIQAVAFAVLSGIVASNKNRNPAGWGVLGFLFGLFAFIAVLVLQKVESEEKVSSSRQRSQPSSTGEFDPEEHEKKCPACAEYIKLEARICKHCGHEFSEEEIEQQISEVSEAFQEGTKNAFHYGKLNTYAHISTLISFLLSLFLIFYGCYIFYNILFVRTFDSVSLLETSISIIIPLLMIFSGVYFIYSTYRVYTNSVYGLVGFIVTSPFFISFFFMIAVYESYVSYQNPFYSVPRTLFYFAIVLIIFSVYYLYKQSYQIADAYIVNKSNETNYNKFDVSELAAGIKSYFVNEIIACVSLLLFVTATAINLFMA